MFEQLNLVRDMSLSMGGATSAEEIYAAALGTVVKLTGASRAAVLLFDSDGHLGFEASVGLSEGYQAAVSGHSPWVKGQAAPEPFLVTDVAAEPSLRDLREVIDAEGIKSLAFIPLVTGGGVIGKFMLYFDQEHQLAWDELQVAQTIAAQTAFAIDRQRAVDLLRVERGLFMTGPTVVFRWKLRPGLPVDYVSPNVLQQCGYRPDELIGEHRYYVTFIHPDDAARVEGEVISRSAGGSSSFDQQFRVHRPDGTYHWVHAFMIMEPDEHGVPAHVLGYMLDITDQRLAAVQREATALKLREAERLDGLSTLAGGVAHDFNNLLMGVLGNAELAIDEMGDVAFVAGRLRDIQRAARRAADLTRQLLAFSGRGRFSHEVMSLNTLLADCTQLLRPILSNKATVVYRLAPDGPAIEGDPTQIRQVVMNLLTNASDALDGGAGRIEICTSLVARVPEQVQLPADGVHREGFALVEISDDGAGMDEATQATMFEPFFTTKTPGRGLGLSAVLGIVRGHHGAVDVLTSPGRGTTIRVYLPAVPVAVEPVAVEPAGGALGAPTFDPSAAGSAAARRASRGVVLVVDDEDLVLDVSSRSLSRAGYEVLMASNGRMALEMLERLDGRVGLLLIDLTMPVLSGQETLDIVHRRWPGLPAILTSGYDAADRQPGNGDRVGFLQKPYGPEELVALVGSVFANSASVV